jgi:hypothetical protein
MRIEITKEQLEILTSALDREECEYGYERERNTLLQYLNMFDIDLDHLPHDELIESVKNQIWKNEQMITHYEKEEEEK